MNKNRVAALLLAPSLAVLNLTTVTVSAGVDRGDATTVPEPVVTEAVAFDTTPPLRDMIKLPPDVGDVPEIAATDRGAAPVGDTNHDADGALQTEVAANAIPGPLFTFEGPSNEDNFRIFGFRVNPPDPNGDVGRNHYVAMVNLVFAIYSKTGQLLVGPGPIGGLWRGFAIPDCSDPSGDPIVLYDEIADRWILTQFTTRFETNQFYNCVAISQTPDPAGPYFRYAFSTGSNFPDYPKYGVWPSVDEAQASLTITTREFPPVGDDQVGIYAIDRQALLAGDPNTQVVEFHLLAPPNLVGDGLLPADFDGRVRPPATSPQVVLGSQDDGGLQGATFDALNVFHLRANFDDPGQSTFGLVKQLPIANFDTIFPCTPTSRDCIPQPGITDPLDDRKLDILSYRQRPTWRLQYRNFRRFEALVTNQSVEARPGIAGVRWWELRNAVDPVIFQEGTWAPDDGVHRWMGSVALDRRANMAVGYSVSNGTDVFPGIRYAGRLASDPLGDLSQGEAVLQAGSGVQTTTNSRWGDYTSMNIDPVDDCTFYYINEYYAISGTPENGSPWQTRIGAFRFRNCG
jgi:hypothetical protein